MRAKRRRLVFEGLEASWLLTGDITLIRHFNTWDAGIIRSTDVAGITYYPPMEHLYLADSEINEIPQIFNGDNIFVTNLLGNEIVREIASNNREPTGITYSDFDGFFYVTNDTSQEVTRYDNDLDDPLDEVVTTDDVSNANDPEGITSDPSTGRLYVIDGSGGGLQVLTYNSNLVFQSSFSVAAQMTEAEGIAFHPPSGHLFIASSNEQAIFEYTVNGVFIEEYDISGFEPEPDEVQGATFAPTSNSNDDPAELAIYLADGMKDNQADGRVFEAVLGIVPVNSPPTVDVGPDQGTSDSVPVTLSFDGSATDDGMPGGPLTFSWTQVSGPGTVSFTTPLQEDTDATFPADGSYVLRLEVDDGELIGSDEVAVFVNTGVIEVRINSPSDDAEERPTGTVLLNSSDLELVEDTAGNQRVGIRFSSVAVPPGVTIVDANVQFQTDETTSVATSLNIQGEDIDHAPTFESSSGDITSRTRTSASVPWSPPPWTSVGQAGPDQKTPNIASVIQEIVDRPGWSSGNALALILSGTGKRVAESYNGEPAAAPLLHVEFTTGPPPENDPPELDPIGNQSVAEGDTLNFTATATDPDVPADMLTFSLDAGAPAEATIHPQTGAFSWTPGEADGPGSFPVMVRVTDDGTPNRDDFEMITITVTEVNEPPILGVIGNRVVAEGDTLSFTAAALDIDVPANGLTFSLDAGAPAEATIHPQTGAFSWTPGEVDGPGSFPVTVRVTDDGTPNRDDFETITITVTEVNQPPVLTPIGDQTVVEGDTMSFTAMATDPDAPANGLTFSLDPGAPITATIDPVTGAFILPTTEGDGPGILLVTVRVTDDGAPNLSDFVTITITVLDVVTVERRVSTSFDDAEERASGKVFLRSGDLELVSDIGGIQTVAVRFTDLDIPQGATISNAYIRFGVDETTSVATSLSIRGEDTDDAAAFASSNGNISSRTETSAMVPWSPAPWTTVSPPGPDQQSPNVGSIIQTIVERPGWSSGNSLAMIITGTGERVAASFDGDPDTAPLLHVEYLMGPS